MRISDWSSDVCSSDLKLTAEAEQVAAEGWKWIEVATEFPYGHVRDLRDLEGVPVEISADEQAAIDALNVEYAKLEAEYEDADELPDDVDQRLGEIEAALAAFDTRDRKSTRLNSSH